MLADVLVAPWAEPAPPPYAGHLLNARQLTALPEDGWLYELVEGHLVRMPPPGYRHGDLVARITNTLYLFVAADNSGRIFAGDVGFNLTLDDDVTETVLAADISFVRTDRLPDESGDEPYMRGAPDLAIEVASPSQFRPEMGAKAWQWLRRGARLVWVVWPSRQEVDVWTPGHDVPVTLSTGDKLEGADVLPGFTLAQSGLFV
jgi:Uma2 family endonuclease